MHNPSFIKTWTERRIARVPAYQNICSHRMVSSPGPEMYVDLTRLVTCSCYESRIFCILFTNYKVVAA